MRIRRRRGTSCTSDTRRTSGWTTKNRTACSNNLISLLDQSFPGANHWFQSLARKDGSQKWVDFAKTFWHVDCVRGISQVAFTERHRKWCKRHGYNFSAEKAEQIHREAREMIALVPKSATTKLLILPPLPILGLDFLFADLRK